MKPDSCGGKSGGVFSCSGAVHCNCTCPPGTTSNRGICEIKFDNDFCVDDDCI